MQVVIVTGEASGDQHGAYLVQAMLNLVPKIKITGIGGSALERAGVDLFFRFENLALMGICEVLDKIIIIWQAIKCIKYHICFNRPNLLILIDFPDFNFLVARLAKRLGIKIMYYISPQVWAWRSKRAKKLAALVDHLAVIFSFEVDFYRYFVPNLPVTFVGHPLLDELYKYSKKKINSAVLFPTELKLIGLLPGSRVSEIARITPLLLKSVKLMKSMFSNLFFVLLVAPGIDHRIFDRYMNFQDMPDLILMSGNLAVEVMAKSQVIIMASGTAALQAALINVPFIVIYQTNMLNYFIAKQLIKIKYIAMPNIIIGRGLISELVQKRATPEAIAAEASRLFMDEKVRLKLTTGLFEIRGKLGYPGASYRAARLALSLVEGYCGSYMDEL